VAGLKTGHYIFHSGRNLAGPREKQIPRIARNDNE
jgi:hypothetical protein